MQVFLSPNESEYDLMDISMNFSNKLYATIHLNFISRLDRRLMEDLARLTVEAGATQIIAKVGPT